MIYISQGHEDGIGLEVFFKSLISLPQSVINTLCLVANPGSCKATLKTLNFPYKINTTHIEILSKTIKVIPIEDDLSLTQSLQSLILILKIIKPDDILVTLPTSKDQLVLKGVKCAGYTEFFRHYFKRDSISMIFKSYDLKVLLLTDHIALKEVPKLISKELILSKCRETLSGIEKYFTKCPDEIFFAGLNPHAGEGGLLGLEDPIIEESINDLSRDFPNLQIKGPLPGDTLHFHHNPTRDQLFIYTFHDQGLPFFKDKYGLFGINITIGLDFLRMSVDHGTAFSLFGKNQASSSGCLYVLNEAFKVHSLPHPKGNP